MYFLKAYHLEMTMTETKTYKKTNTNTKTHKDKYKVLPRPNVGYIFQKQGVEDIKCSVSF